MSSEIVIRTKGLGKAYHIFKRPEDRLKQMLWRGRKTYYSEYWALSGVDFEVRKGETIGIIGKNGSGKSTFLQLVCGTLTPTTGTVEVHGRIAALLELGAGFNPEFTGRENVYLSASVLGLTQSEIDARFDEILEFAGIGDFIDQPVKLYSSGMFARLAFSVAAHVDADILIIDEILAVGDAAFTQKCYRFIHRFKQQGTLFFVSHDTNSVMQLCDRALWLDAGNVRSVGPAKEVCRDYLAALYAAEDDSGSFEIGKARKHLAETPQSDHRAETLKEHGLSSRIELFDFNPESPWFGQRGATITKVELLNADGSGMAVIEGGEEVALRIECSAAEPISRPIVGFMLRDKRGQQLFGDNTYLTYRDAPLGGIGVGASFCAEFKFQLPYLPPGEYAVTAAVAEGTQADHIQHHWVDEALLFSVHASHVSRGLVGIPMHSIEIRVNAPNFANSLKVV